MFSLKVLQVLPGYEERFHTKANERHRQMFFPLSLAIFLAEFVLTGFQALRFGVDLLQLSYFYIYLVAAIVSGVFLVLYQGYRKGRFKRHQHVVDYAFVLCFFGLALLTSLAEIQTLHTLSIIFIIFSSFVSILLYFSVKTLFLTVGFANLALIICITLFNFSWDIKFGLILNTVFLLMANLCLIIPFHNGHVQSFNQEIELERANAVLKKTNLRLEVMNKQLEETSVTDALTGILNRLAFNKALALSYEQALLMGEGVGVILLDVDHFKQYNDHFGHLEGDRCLKLIAHTIQQNLKRPSDHVFRYGGEEFVVLLPGSTAEGAETVAIRILQEIENLNIPQAKNEQHITISAGVHAMTPERDDNMFSLVDKADKALYHAKHEGRNRVSVFDQLPRSAQDRVPS